jgi:uncharacterized protein (TIGR02246 family)
MATIDDIRETAAAMAAAINDKDAARVASFYTPDGAIMPPAAPQADGIAGIEGYWQAAIDAGLRDVALETVEVEAFGDTATETGRVTGRMGDTALAGKFVVIWKRQAGGWKLHRDIFNFDA